jgi:hypothetical protein
VTSIAPAAPRIAPPAAAPAIAAAPRDAVVTPNTALSGDALLVKLSARPNFREVLHMPRGAERKAAAWTQLTTVASTSQAPVVDLANQLKASGAIKGFETLVSPNMVIVEPAAGKRAEVMKALAAAQGVRTIYDNEATPIAGAGAVDAQTAAGLLHEPMSGLDVFSRGKTVKSLAPGVDGEPTTPYGVSLVGAPDAWKSGADGHGLVYGSIDTGVDRTHEAIAARYRGLQADGTINDDYNWFDFGGGKSATPVDPDHHGTHTIGTVLGTAPTANIGVAPQAKFISAHGLAGNADVRLKALQFMQAPTKRDGTAPDPSLAPDVVGMSWWTGPNWSDFFSDSLDNLVAAGIEPIKSAGNNGPGPETGSSPGVFRQIDAVAAVDKDSQIADFSSRGPSPLPHNHSAPLPKPDFAAPGVDVFSSVPGNKYQQMSGTSMAQPHFSGVVLDVLSKYPQLTHDQLNTVLAKSATDLGARGRDLEFGNGLVNVPRALDEAAKLLNLPPASAPAADAPATPPANEVNRGSW